ncbi:MAG: hypothetical protein A2X08_08220 [Bacteroidetes bacterium GWA2_32_17]|nr:MAG: hypothetical protein A2X08_08220 [Bacteroidetes bacterium GWA2_32_17]
MATLISDHEIKKLLGSVIINGDITSVRPNSYILRLGEVGEFLNANKEFELGKKKKGIKVPPGHSVALTAFEILDFSRETVEKIFPNIDLHAIVSPTTDLSREGIVAATTHVDSGYHGTLNWTITNTSSEERRFVFKERIFRLVIFKLEKDERPESVYDGNYQGETGYIRSKRGGAPVGMKEEEWENSLVDGGPEVLLEGLIKSGYPWNILGQKLKAIDLELKNVSNEYGAIYDSIEKLTTKVTDLDGKSNQLSQSISGSIKDTLSSEINAIQNRWLIGGGTLLFVFIGLILTITGNPIALQFLKYNAIWIGPILVIAGIVVFYLISKRAKKH